MWVDTHIHTYSAFNNPGVSQTSQSLTDLLGLVESGGLVTGLGLARTITRTGFY